MTLGTTRWWMVVGMLALVAGASWTVRAEQGPQALFERARLLEENGKTLPDAIALYKQVAAQAGSNRALAAQALLRAGECYQRLGDPQAQTFYARVVREYGDQIAAAALAKTRLGTTGGTSGIVKRQVWTGPEVDTTGAISADGRFLSFVDRETGDLAVRDLAAGTTRRLTKGPGDWSDFSYRSAISRDSTQIAFAWYFEKTGQHQLRVAKLGDPGVPSARVLLDNPDIDDPFPFDWSPDGKWIAVHLGRQDRTAQIGLVSTATGALTVLTSVDWRGPTNMSFSPDSRYLAYDLPVDDSLTNRDVFILSVDGSTKITAVSHESRDVLAGWSPDGSSLLFASDRAGSQGLWALAMSGGRPHGPAALIHSDLGPLTSSFGVTRNGALVFGTLASAPNIYTAVIDLEAGKVTSPPQPLVENYLRANRQPAWSRDGRSIAYVSSIPGQSASVLAIRSLETGQTTERALPMTWFVSPGWAPDGSITIGGSDIKGRRGIYRVDPNTGQVTLIFSGGDCLAEGQSWLPDGRLVYRRGCGPGGENLTIVLRDLATGTEQELARGKYLSLNGIDVSPDGHFVTYVETDRPTKSNTLFAVPTTGGSPKALLRLTQPDGFEYKDWTPDGRLLVGTTESGKMTSMLISPVTGSRVPLNLELPSATLHPDGRRVAFWGGRMAHEVWTLENFLPKAK